LHSSELEEIPALASLLPKVDSSTVQIFIGDDPEQFQLAMHLIRCQGRLELGEKIDIGVLKSYRHVARKYSLGMDITHRIDAWILAHKNGVGGATNAQEEIRGLKLTRALNPERGDALVSSALAEAYLEQAEKALESAKKVRLLQKAESCVRTVLPILVTSMSVSRADEEQKKAVAQVVSMLKKCLVMQEREGEAMLVDSAIREFQAGILGSAEDLARASRAQLAPGEMYS